MGLKVNLTGAQEISFDPIPAGTYDAVVFEVEVRENQGGGKLPTGTQGLNVMFKITQEPYENRRVFNTYWIAPDGYETKSNLDGMLFGFLKAIGYAMEPGKLNIEPDELQGLECKVVVGVREARTLDDGRQVDAQNNVRRVKSIHASDEASDALLPS